MYQNRVAKPKTIAELLAIQESERQRFTRNVSRSWTVEVRQSIPNLDKSRGIISDITLTSKLDGTWYRSVVYWEDIPDD